MPEKFYIIITGWNCAHYVDKCVHSILNQSYQNFSIFAVDDNSQDETFAKLTPYIGPNFHLMRNPVNLGAAYGRDQALKMCRPYDIVLFMGMDDELLPGAFERILQEYDAGKLMTYGNWVNQDGNGLPADFELDFPDNVHADRSYRKVKYRSTAPNTFRRFLYDCIDPYDLQLNGEWYKATTESEVMFSCLEQCGKDRIGVIKDYIYLYNMDRLQKARTRFGIDYQTRIYNNVISKPRRELWITEE